MKKTENKSYQVDLSQLEIEKLYSVLRWVSISCSPGNEDKKLIAGIMHKVNKARPSSEI